MSRVLDMCCGSKMFWFDKRATNVTFCDVRKEDHELCDGRKISIIPDIVCDFQNMPFGDEIFDLVVFDPPRLIRVGKNSYMFKKYGALQTGWQTVLKNGFDDIVKEILGIGAGCCASARIMSTKTGERLEYAPLSQGFKRQIVKDVLGNRIKAAYKPTEQEVAELMRKK